MKIPERLAKTDRRTVLLCALIAIHILFVLWYTVGRRGLTDDQTHLELFWSYRSWMSGNRKLGWQILGNLAMLFPLGFLLSSLTQKKRYLLIPPVFSCVIELAQLLTMRGMFEFDDILNNTVGAVLGWIAAKLIGKRFAPQIGGALLVALCVAALLYPTKEVPLQKVICIQAEADGSGFAFYVGRDTPMKYTILLRHTATGKLTQAQAQYGIKRQDVQEYFGGSCDYTYSGFRIMMPTDECEIVLRFNPLVRVKTVVYVSSAGVHNLPEKEAVSPALDQPFITDGILMTYRPDRHCWVYQYNGALYWVADEGFAFEEDGSTYVTYKLLTHGRAADPSAEGNRSVLYWYGMSGDFEEYEIRGDFGKYRVMMREIPDKAPLYAVVTGYKKDGDWIWKEYFRPRYSF